MFTAPAFCGILGNVIAIVIAVFALREEKQENGDELEENENGQVKPTIPPYDKIAVVLCLMMQMCYMLMIAVIETVHTVFAMSMFEWTKKEAQLYGSMRLTAYGILTLIIYVLDAAANIWSRTESEGWCCDWSSLCLCFPFDHLLLVVPTRRTQVSERVYPCERYASAESRAHWLPKSFRMVRGCPSSKHLVVQHFLRYPDFFWNSLHKRQYEYSIYESFGTEKGKEMGLLMFVGYLAKTIGPLCLSYVFQHYGPRPVWTLMMVFTGTTAVLWVRFYKRMAPLEI